MNEHHEIVNLDEWVSAVLKVVSSHLTVDPDSLGEALSGHLAGLPLEFPLTPSAALTGSCTGGLFVSFTDPDAAAPNPALVRLDRALQDLPLRG